MIAGARRFRYRKFALGMKELVGAGRTHEDRRVVSGAEQLDAGIDLRDVVEPMRHQLKFEEVFAVCAKRDLVIDAGSHVAEMRRRHVLATYRLEIKHVDGVLWTFDQATAPRGCPDHWIGQFGGCLHAVGCKRRGCRKRAGPKILQETAPARGANDR